MLGAPAAKPLCMNASELAMRLQGVHVAVAYLLWHQGRLAESRLLLVSPYGEDSQNNHLCQWLLTSIEVIRHGLMHLLGRFKFCCLSQRPFADLGLCQVGPRGSKTRKVATDASAPESLALAEVVLHGLTWLVVRNC